ncbi:S-adenosyl-L-methionine-dependent methyltransferase [Annulohypoxylon truncatum]|uniref:S-adenosyl-L-methionine-dependent methyltransferase n=1 Tax=Annulohypoxylon truncatum TaxID=327061 RepID=UPI002008D403|nr:S-adenosyl-L-methionine-dependent methyltransferase [Annulohypoxylon truncatum]KAI1212152.1 S-adenosyl-L-methionine-dependent methyltransferase [Annulohypoxylon truncatum]
MASLRPISELAIIIERNTRIIEDGLKGSPGAQFSLALGAPPQIELPHSLETTRGELLETLDELRSRVLGPLGYLFAQVFPTPALVAIFQTLYTFDIASHVPLSPGDEISYTDLAKSCSLPEDEICRIVQGAIAFRIFEEVTPDVSIRHNAISAAFTVPQMKDLLGLFVGEQLTGCFKIVESLQRYPGTGEPGHSASVLAFREAKAIEESGINKEIADPSKNLFDYLAEDETRVARFRSAMGISTKSLAFRSSYFVDSLPWADKDQCPETIVDIGGSGGDLCHQVLRTYPHVKKAVVLDLPEVIADVKVPGDLENRLEFAGYNFLTQEVTHQADAYLFRHIFHDWSDKYGAKILKNLVPALRKGTKIWICELVLPPLSDRNHTRDQTQRTADIFMMSGFNSKERSRSGWEALLAAADERLRIANIMKPDGAHDSTIEIVFDA